MAGLVTPSLRSKKTPAACPAASSAAFVLASLGKSSVPAGLSPPVVLVNDASATSPSTPPWSRPEMVAYSRQPLIVSE